MKNFILTCLVVSFCCFAVYYSYFKIRNETYFEIHEIPKFIDSLNTKEKEYLTNLFKLQFFLNSFGYTIFGKKPMSFDIIDYNQKFQNIDNIEYMNIEHIWDRYRLKEGWAVWKKYANRFHQNYISIIEYPCHLNSNCIEIAVINHNNFIKVINDNLNYFQSILGNSFSPTQILEEYLKGSGDIFCKIRLHDGLFGTLLGYGCENAIEYNRSGRPSEAMVSFTPFEETSSELEKNGTKNILPPLFAVIPNSKETLKLKASYEKQRIKINEIYQDQNLLEDIFLKLVQ